jgi:hypothetical protein
MLERLAGALRAGPQDRDRAALVRLIEQIKQDKKPLGALVEGLRPLIRQVAMSALARQDVASMRACADALRLVRSP